MKKQLQTAIAVFMNFVQHCKLWFNWTDALLPTLIKNILILIVVPYYRNLTQIRGTYLFMKRLKSIIQNKVYLLFLSVYSFHYEGFYLACIYSICCFGSWQGETWNPPRSIWLSGNLYAFQRDTDIVT